MTGIASERGALRWNKIVDLAAIVAGHTPGRSTPEDITLFDSLGVASEDIAAAATVLDHTRTAGRGLQDPIPERAG